MAKQTIKCENSYIIQKSIDAGWKDYMQGLESKKILVLNLKDGF